MVTIFTVFFSLFLCLLKWGHFFPHAQSIIVSEKSEHVFSILSNSRKPAPEHLQKPRDQLVKLTSFLFRETVTISVISSVFRKHHVYMACLDAFLFPWLNLIFKEEKKGKQSHLLLFWSEVNNSIYFPLLNPTVAYATQENLTHSLPACLLFHGSKLSVSFPAVSLVPSTVPDIWPCCSVYQLNE